MKSIHFLPLLAMCLMFSLVQPQNLPAKERSSSHEPLMETIERYAPTELKNRLKQDLAEHDRLMAAWRHSPGFQQDINKWNAAWKQMHKVRREELKTILKQLRDGQLTIDQAQQRIDKLRHVRHEAMHRLVADIRIAAARGDRKAVTTALEELDRKIKRSNQRLSRQLQVSEHSGT
ncbi:MAG: hypothetical protein LKI80_03465 [Sporolactobacillus sp.]|jgi:hypothetical protein|nr:hypothetical protein [Sporolactobacillus sp.]